MTRLHRRSDFSGCASYRTSVNSSRPPVEAVLVYDGECLRCSHAAGAFDVLPRYVAVDWHDATAADALAAQFHEVPPTMVLIDRSVGQVHAGEAVLTELSRRRSIQSIADRFSGHEHEHAAGVVGAADERAGSVLDATGVHPLRPGVRTRLPALIAAAESDGSVGDEADDAVDDALDEDVLADDALDDWGDR